MACSVRKSRSNFAPLLATLIMVGSCASGSSAKPAKTAASAAAPCGEGRILYLVSDQEGPELDDVHISIVTKSGIRSLMKTDFTQGNVCLEKAIIRDPGTYCILFCREGYHCGALIPNKELLKFGELKIALARIMI